MSIRSIIVQFDLDEPVRPRVDFAAALAERFDAHLIGFAAGKIVPLVSTTDGVVVEPAIYQEQITDIENRIGVIRKAFEQAMANRDASFRGHVGDPAHLLALHARAADLIVAGKQCDDPYSAGLDVGDLVLNAGRPVLLAADGHAPLKAERIVVAWRDTREARRAITDAMPFLTSAEEVLLVTLGEEDDSSPERESLADVAKYLERHVARVNTDLVDAGARRQGEAIAKIAADHGADLVVAGAYGHSRLREWIFGGMTRELLDEGSISRLFSN